MDREYIKDKNGDDVRTRDGDRVFYSTDDGDPNPDTSQTTYTDKGFSRGSTKNDSTYNPSEGKFND